MSDQHKPHAARHNPPSGGPEAGTLPPGSAHGWDQNTATALGQADTKSFVSAFSLPDYEVLGELGRGGMGVVYKAVQIKLKRLVALKMVLAGAHAGEGALARFRREAEAVARLRHPNIVQIYEIGEEQGRPYFSLEYLEGGSLAGKLKGTPVSARDAAHLVETLARAVHYAHQQGIVHRDLKPANVLLTADGTPKVADFGLAKQADSTDGQTQDGAVLGTPSYMSPEQAGGKSKDIGPAADTYALGAMLYELLTGRPPFRGATAMDTVIQVVADDPVPPTRLQPRVPQDLETVCLKCLEKAPNKRYASASELADDLRRYLDGEPIHARPAGVMERVVKWVWRNPTVAALSAAVVLLSVAAFAVVTWLWLNAAHQAEQARLARKEAVNKAKDEAAARADAEKERNRAQDNEKLANRRKRESEMQLERSRQLAFTAQIWRAGGLYDRDPALALALLENREACPLERRDFAWRYYRQLANRLTRRFARNPEMDSNAVAPNGKFVACSTADGKLLLYGASTGQKMATLVGHKGAAHHLTFSRDGSLLAAGDSIVGMVRVWDTRTYALKSLEFPDKVRRHVLSLAFHPGGQTLAVGGGFYDEEKAKSKTESDSQWRMAAVWVWDLESNNGKVLAATASSKIRVPLLTGNQIENSGANSLAYSRDGKMLAVGLTRSSATLLLDAETGVQKHRFWKEAGWIGGMAFSPDGNTLVYGNSTSNVFVWDLKTKKLRHILRGHLGHIHSVVFSTDGSSVYTTGDSTARKWDLADGQLRSTLRCLAPTRELGLLAGGKQLLVTTTGEAQVWSLSVPISLGTLRAKAKDWDAGSSALAFAQDSDHFAVAGQDAHVRVWDATRRAVLHDLPGHEERSTAVAFGPAGSGLLVSGDEIGQVLLWRLGGGKPVELNGHRGAINCVAITPDGKTALAGGADGTVRLWEADGKLIDTIKTGHDQVNGLALFDGGKLLLTGGNRGHLRVWGMKDRQLIKTIGQGQNEFTARIAVTPDGRTAATISGGIVTLHDLSGGVPAMRYRGASGALSLAFTSDGKTLAVGAVDRAVRLYDVASGHMRAEFIGHTHEAMALAFSRDGSFLATASRDQRRWDHKGEVKLWGAPFPKVK
jgi:WD40 repeat protein